MFDTDGLDSSEEAGVVTSMGRNSTLQPISELGGGGLNLIVCQLVDCRFCKHTPKVNERQAGALARASPAPSHLEMIRVIFIVQVKSLLKDGDRISDEEVSDVLGQQLVYPCRQKSTVQQLL